MFSDEIGLARGTVRLTEYTQTWEGCFRAERAAILRALEQTAVDVQHVGSTSVPGLPAKPIIDIAIGVKSLDDVKQAVSALTTLGYEYFGCSEERGGHFFAKGPDHARTYYLHLVEMDSHEWRDYLAFRDTLRADPILRGEYAELKRRLAAQYASERGCYTAEKAWFIEYVLGRDRMSFDGIEWIFLDMGETIIDETRAMDQRYLDIRSALVQHDIHVSIDDIEAAFRQALVERKPIPFERVLELLGAGDETGKAISRIVRWRSDLEDVVPGTKGILENLHSRFQLGIIANQSPGAEERLEKRGLRSYFDFVLGSGDIGLAKPDERIFRLALEMAQCPPERSVMIGDRVDNDIRPAKLLGMKTIRVLKGLGAFQQPMDQLDLADYTADSLADAERMLLAE
jgi:HAD superfamily hydrolase (TIGR01509 family)